MPLVPNDPKHSVMLTSPDATEEAKSSTHRSDKQIALDLLDSLPEGLSLSDIAREIKRVAAERGKN